jgi:hypothetical protein
MTTPIAIQDEKVAMLAHRHWLTSRCGPMPKDKMAVTKERTLRAGGYEHNLEKDRPTGSNLLDAIGTHAED